MLREQKYRQYADKIRLFNRMSPDDIETLLKHGKTFVYPKGKTIFHEGQMGDSLFIVLSGKIAIYQKDKMIAKCSVGDAFGEMSVLNHQPRVASAVALKETKVFTLDESQIQKLMKHGQAGVKLLFNVIHVLSERLENANAKNAELRKRLDIATPEE